MSTSIRRVTLLVNSLMSGGTEKQVILTAVALKDQYDVQLISYYGDQWDEKNMEWVKEQKIDLVQLSGNHLSKTFKLIRLLKSRKTDFLFCYLATANIQGGISGKLAGVKVIVGGIRNALLSRNKFLIQRFFHNHVYNFTLFNNRAGEADMSERGFEKLKCRVIDNCFINSERLREREKVEKVEILSVGRFVAQKDYTTALSAIQKLRNTEGLKFRYTIIGYGVLENLIREEIKNKGLEEQVRIVLNPPDLVRYFEQSSIFLNTSLFEGQSNAIMEAMSFSLPVVASRVGDNGHLVKEGETGLLFEARDSDAAADQLKALAHSVEKRNELGKAGYLRLESHFSFDRYQKSYEEFIERNLS